ncbi:RNA-directed DNA polymerase [Tanacetum coccineum]
MDAAHILLGRHWQFDRKKKHDRFQNTYSFKKDGVNINLVPFDSRQTQAEGSNFEAPLQVQPFLREFAHVIPSDIPPGLPAMRDIQHCINFILGFAIPNRPAYRINPKEFVKLQRQVTELLDKGLIWENMSLCAIPALLIDLRSGYHQIWIRPGDEWKTAFKTRDGLSIIAPLTECMKGGRFTWTSEASKAFDILKAKVIEAPILALPNYNEVFQVGCDASKVGIGSDFYAIVRSLDTWRHYLLSNEFVMFSDHEALKFINGQHKLKPRHAKWVKFIQAFSFVIRHKIGSNNQVTDALICRHSLITTMQIRVQGFDSFRGVYCDDPDFREIWSKCDNGPFQQFSKLDGYLFKGARLLERCRTCHIAKTHSSNAGLYTPLSVPVAPWEDVNLDFVLDVKFVSHLWRTLWTRLGSKLQFSSSHHPQTDGQTKVVNRSLGNLLRSLIGDNAKQWDLILPQAEFAYNRSVNRTTSKSPFEVVYGRNPITPLDLVLVPEMGQFSEEGPDQSEQIKELHRSVQKQIIQHNKKYKEHADKRRRFGKLKPRRDGPFRVLKKINDNGYNIELPSHYNVSATFNVADLSPYKGDSDDEPDSGSGVF